MGDSAHRPGTLDRRRRHARRRHRLQHRRLRRNASATSPLRAKAQCRINFQASSLHLQVGQDLVLTWTAVGADKLSASWTSGYIPFAGAVTTTMNRPGTFSYQVTGTHRRPVLRRRRVEVNFAGDTPSHASETTVSSRRRPRVSAAERQAATHGGTATAAGTGTAAATAAPERRQRCRNGNGGTGTAAPATAVARTASAGNTGSGNYPAQSPTGGSGVAWYPAAAEPVGSADWPLLRSLALWKREHVRAPFVHQH